MSGVPGSPPVAPVGLLTARDVRRLSQQLDVVPRKSRGQNFVIDPNTIRRIVGLSEVGAGDIVLEIGPGLGSLTLGLLDVARSVVALEIDPVMAGALPATVAVHTPGRAGALQVVTGDALGLPSVLDAAGPGVAASLTALVANLPYNISVPVLLRALETLPSLRSGLVLVQSEVARRLTATPGSKIYGVPSVKVAWWAEAVGAGPVPRSVFWPVPNVESELVRLRRRPPPSSTSGRAAVFAVVDAAFAQRRKTLRSALAGWAGSASTAEAVLRRADIDPGLRGEVLPLADFVRIADAAGRPDA